MLYVKKLTETAKLPTRAHPNDAGLDLYADEDVLISAFHRAVVKTGIAVSIDPGKVGLIWPRSGLATKGVSTDAGVIDASYRGMVGVVLTNGTPFPFSVKQGDKIAQLLIQPICPDEVIEKNELSETARAGAGFGSTGA